MPLRLIAVLKIDDQEVRSKTFVAGSGEHLYVGRHVCPDGFLINVGVPGEIQLFTHRQYRAREPNESPWNLFKHEGMEVALKSSRLVEWHRASGAHGEWCALHADDAGSIKFPDGHVIEFHHEP
jgi:hypothetical protein